MKKKFIFFCIFALTFSLSLPAQIITTIAGIGPSGPSGSFSGDGGPATSAGLFHPAGIAVDSAGVVYFADGGNDRVRMVKNGIITTIAGNGYSVDTGDGGPATNAGLASPIGLAIDRHHNIYVTTSSFVRKIDTAGIITDFAGNGSFGYSGDGGQATAGQIGGAIGVAVDRENNVYIAENGDGNYIRKVDSTGIITTIAGNGITGYSGDGGPATNAEFNYILGVAADRKGNVYVSDFYNYCIRKIDSTGIISTFAGDTITGYSGDGGPATAAELGGINGISVDTTGNVYVTDYVNNRIRRVSISNGIIASIAGDGPAIPAGGFGGDGGPATLASLFAPSGTAVAANGNLYIADARNNRIRLVTLPQIAITAIPGDTICIGKADTFMATVTNDAIAPICQWRLNGDSVGSDTVYIPDTLHNGDVVSCILTYIFGDTLTTYSNSIIVTVKDCTTGVGSIAANDQVIVFPNPNDGAFTLSFPANSNEPARITVTNMLGEKIKEIVTATNDPLTIQLDAPAGVYFLSAVTEEGKYNTKVIVTK